jgi:DeoR family transcriptional regulator, fructose operon transcriptional repressor
MSSSSRRKEASRYRPSAGLFDVSQVTIRKDLSELEGQGVLQRTYGGAVLSHRSRFSVSFFQRLKMHSSPKNAIALAALSYIRESDTIIIDAYSSTVALAQIPIGRFRSLYIITSSVPAALEVSQAGYELLLVGARCAIIVWP